MRGLIFTCIIFVFTVFTPLFAREGMEGLRYGKLENGLTYYVKHSEGALGRVSNNISLHQSFTINRQVSTNP